MGAERVASRELLLPSALVLLLLFSVVTPILSISQSDETSLEQNQVIAPSTSFSNGNGEQFAGQTMIINASDWLVDSTRGMDVWQTTTINTSLTFDEIELSRDDRGRARGCLHEDSGGVWIATLEFGGTTTITQVDAGGVELGKKCSIVIDERELLHIAYTNESGFLKVAYQRASGLWNMRTIENQTSVSKITLLLDSAGAENVVWLDSNNGLHFASYTTWWTHQELLKGTRVGAQYEVYLDSDDSLNIFYQNLDTTQMIHGILGTDGNWTLTTLTAGQDLGPAMSFAKDPSTGNIQYVYGSSNSSGLTIVRDLTGQENGRLSPSIETLTTGAVSDEYATQVINDLDFDCDGIDDLIVSRPAANTEIGAVDIFWGSGMGISSLPDYNLTGSAGGDRFGSAIANAGDVNGDGCSDLIIGAPGATNNLGFATGVSYIFYGGNRTYSAANWSDAGEGGGDKFGGTVSSAGDVNNDSYADILVAATGFTQTGGEGKVYLYLGSATGPSTDHDWYTRGYWVNVIQGWSMAGIGDINGDGFDDIALGAAGSFSELTGNGRVEVYTGSLLGSMTLDNYWTTTTTNTLLGYSVLGIGDVNQDGYDDFAYSEPLYDNLALGKVTVLRGSANGLPDNPALELIGTESSQAFGSAMSTIGDINDDGLSEIAISSIGINSIGSGKVEYFFADNSQLLRRGVNSILMEGVSGQHLGRTISGGGDVDGDGLFEIIVTSLDKDMDGNSAGAVVQIEKRNNEYSDIPMVMAGAPIDDVDLYLDDSGRFHLFLKSSILNQTRHLERPNAITNAADEWQGISYSANASMVVTRSGKTIVLDDSNTFIEQAAHTILTTPHPLATHNRMDLDLVIDNEQSLIFTTSYQNATVSDVELRAETDSGFLTSTVVTNSSLGAGISSAFALTHPLVSGDSWNISGTNSNGSEEYGASSGCQLDNGTGVLVSSVVTTNQTILSYIDANGSVTTFSIWGYQSDNDVACLSDGTLQVALVNDSGAAEVLSVNGSNVTSLMTTSLTPTYDLKSHIMNQNMVLFTEQTQTSDAKLCTISTANCVGLTIPYSSSDLLSAGSTGDGVLWIAFDGGPGVERMTLAIIHDYYGNVFIESVYTATAAGDMCGVDMETDATGVIRVVACHFDLNSNNRLTSYRIYSDWDRDFVPDPWDEVPRVGGQWNDADADGYGDNPDGPTPDKCINSGTDLLDRGSRWGYFGCSDQDLDGWADAVDICQFTRGNSWVDRKGCEDSDGDGWSTDNDQNPVNWYQQRDTDGDGHYDNHGPDCCGGSSNDIYPLNGNQWEDLDNDGWGDNHNFQYANESLRLFNGHDVDGDGDPDWFNIDWTGDQCPGLQGFSENDRGGCLDTDGDGWSDPHIAQNAQESTWVYNRSQCNAIDSDGRNGCADNWPGGNGNSGEPCGSIANCSQQWHDKDGDGYGDNTTPNAWLQDAFNEDPSQWNDTDLDGFGDNPTGTTADACPVIWGNSTVDRFGCQDDDGDGWSNPDVSESAHPNGNADSNSSNGEQWRDSDGDGFGDFTNRTNGDFCPQQFGYANGDGGRGCPLPAEDSDGDGIIDDDDICGDTTIGEVVDTSGQWMGCSENQKDSDGDGVSNYLDRCANTTALAEVDENGCSQDQLTLDTDVDGVPDIEDECPNTDSLQIDEYFDNVTGCAPYQLDEDNDSVSNALDECAGTPDGAEVDEVGCPRNDIDTDGDGFFDDVDVFPLEVTQWGDLDMDGFGNELSGFQGDSCTNVAGNSSGPPNGDRWGCPDTDGDGWSDPSTGWGVEEGADAFINDPTQWKDNDGDGFGDNITGFEGDECPLSAGVKDGVQGVGCPAATGVDGNVVDECTKWEDFYNPTLSPGMIVPDEYQSCEWYNEWYGSSESSTLPMTMIGIGAGALLVLALISLFVIRLIRGGDDWDEDDDDVYDEFEDDDDIFSSPSEGGWNAPAARQDFSGLGGDQPPRAGPTGRAGSPSRAGGGATSRRPRGGSGPSRPGGASGPPSRAGPPGRAGGRPASAAPRAKKTRRTVVSDDSAPANSPSRKVRKVAGAPKPENIKTRSTRKTQGENKSVRGSGKKKLPEAPSKWEDIFTPRDSANYEKSLGEARASIATGEPERNILRQLQTSGWNAKQSRYIVNEAGLN
ncbi:MAG: hypothetical protein CXX81_15420 [Methanobacteriota archaeon]|nr:MAG: hypothetical protein CXX81_15420 [Euryarchaeota archaeon]